MKNTIHISHIPPKCVVCDAALIPGNAEGAYVKVVEMCHVEPDSGMSTEHPVKVYICGRCMQRRQPYINAEVGGIDTSRLLWAQTKSEDLPPLTWPEGRPEPVMSFDLHDPEACRYPHDMRSLMASVDMKGK